MKAQGKEAAELKALQLKLQAEEASDDEAFEELLRLEAEFAVKLQQSVDELEAMWSAASAGWAETRAMTRSLNAITRRLWTALMPQSCVDAVLCHMLLEDARKKCLDLLKPSVGEIPLRARDPNEIAACLSDNVAVAILNQAGLNAGLPFVKEIPAFVGTPEHRIDEDISTLAAVIQEFGDGRRAAMEDVFCFVYGEEAKKMMADENTIQSK